MQEVGNLKRTENLVLITNDVPQGHEQQLGETLDLMNITPFQHNVCLTLISRESHSTAHGKIRSTDTHTFPICANQYLTLNLPCSDILLGCGVR